MAMDIGKERRDLRRNSGLLAKVDRRDTCQAQIGGSALSRHCALPMCLELWVQVPYSSYTIEMLSIG